MTAPPILIYGPTASGKSALALALAERLGGVVINADALQVYAEWRVLTARPPAQDEARAPHRLYGHVRARDPWSVGLWLADLARALEDCAAQGLRPIIAGGTGLYFKAATEGLAPIPAPSDAAREAAAAALARLGREGLAEALAARDPDTASRIDRANPARLLRAWETLETSGRGLASYWDATPPPLLDGFAGLRLEPDRAALYAAIDARFDAMLAQGALEEARAVQRLGLPPEAPALQALGARELFAHLRGKIALAAAADQARQASRRYAKRQLTWGRNQMTSWRRLTGPNVEAALAYTARSRR